MKVLVSPDFSQKLATLSKDALGKLSAFVSEAENTDMTAFISSENYNIAILEEDVYSAKFDTDAGRIFFTIGTDWGDEFLLLLDVASMSQPAKATTFFASNNPRTNNAYNPKLNPTINPRLNSLINPKTNSSINPKLNSTLNPKLNSAINPKLNSALNYKLNSAINPRLNSAINPRLNSSLNPRINKSYGGPYLYDVELRQLAYVVRVSDKVDILFEAAGDFCGLIISASDNVKIEFDKENSWAGFYVKANEKVWLRFSLNNEWEGLLV
ncbi:hypothetical protein [Pseudomonas sp. R9.37]|uniref:hypothetical protein n=1 Tax=Pseudomonas sp. R9.37 TaxID=1390498 RepID=UPI000D0CC0CB|nr:hypothetical protein [Pseudomonas sp. R9.37]PSL94850.1 hypothetical protein C7U57_10455 [Pseudomonas sp. R9.37]